MNTLPSIDYMRAEVSYDPDTGEMRWKKGKQGRSPDRAVGASLNGGYRCIAFDGVQYRQHRVAFAIYYGREPKGEIDHIDRNKLNNVISNLREATRGENARNIAGRGAHGKGVFRHPFRKKNPFQARIQLNGRLQNLGSFPTIEQARAAYLDAAHKLHGEFACPN